MAYNRRNRLLKILAIQKIYMEKRQEGLTAKAIYELHIRGQFLISSKCFFNYLNVKVKSELKSIDRPPPEPQAEDDS